LEETIAKQLAGPPLCPEGLENATPGTPLGYDSTPRIERKYSGDNTLGGNKKTSWGGTATLARASELWTVTPEPEGSGGGNELTTLGDTPLALDKHARRLFTS